MINKNNKKEELCTCQSCDAEYRAPTSKRTICIKCYLKKYPASKKEKYYRKYYDKLVE